MAVVTVHSPVDNVDKWSSVVSKRTVLQDLSIWDTQGALHTNKQWVVTRCGNPAGQDSPSRPTANSTN